jgi:hypothetical protein
MGKAYSVWVSDLVAEQIDTHVRNSAHKNVSKFLKEIIEQSVGTKTDGLSSAPFIQLAEVLCPAYVASLQAKLKELDQRRLLADLLVDMAQHTLPTMPVHTVSWTTLQELKLKLTTFRSYLVISQLSATLESEPRITEVLEQIHAIVDVLIDSPPAKVGTG